MQARVKWVEGLTFLGESASGHQILMDGNSGDKAPSPMEMVLMAAGGCSAIDVVSILQKGRQDVTNCEVKLTSERREEAPRLFTHINQGGRHRGGGPALTSCSCGWAGGEKGCQA